MTHESEAIPFLTSYGFEYLTLFNKVCGLYRHLKVNSSFMPKNLAKTGPKVKIIPVELVVGTKLEYN